MALVANVTSQGNVTKGLVQRKLPGTSRSVECKERAGGSGNFRLYPKLEAARGIVRRVRRLEFARTQYRAMITKVQAVASRESCHLIPGGIKRPKSCHQDATQHEDANRSQELWPYHLPVSLADLFVNSGGNAPTPEFVDHRLFLNHRPP
jgi:hypothetical protein